MILETLPQPDVHLSRSWWWRYYIKRAVGRVVSYIPNFGAHLARLERLVWMLRRAAHSEAAYRINRNRATGSGAADSSSKSGYGYNSETEELRVAKMYKASTVTE
jgi:hypothetical protein